MGSRYGFQYDNIWSDKMRGEVDLQEWRSIISKSCLVKEEDEDFIFYEHYTRDSVVGVETTVYMRLNTIPFKITI